MFRYPSSYTTVHPTPMYTVVYTTHDGRTIYERVPIKTVCCAEEPELNPGDTSALDDFLGVFADEKK